MRKESPFFTNEERAEIKLIVREMLDESHREMIDEIDRQGDALERSFRKELGGGE